MIFQQNTIICANSGHPIGLFLGPEWLTNPFGSKSPISRSPARKDINMLGPDRSQFTTDQSLTFKVNVLENPIMLVISEIFKKGYLIINLYRSIIARLEFINVADD